MSEDETEPSAGGPEYDQLVLVGIALIGLVIAASVVMAFPGLGFEMPDGEIDTDGNGDSDLLEWFCQLFGWLLQLLQLDHVCEADCSVNLLEEPIPGDNATIQVTHQGDPVEGAPVWFGDRFAGETDEEGIVSGPVPYSEELDVKVGAPEDALCVANVDTGAHSQAGTQATGATTENTSISFDVRAEPEILVEGSPEPGETVTLVVSIQGTPVPAATVELEGDTVGETDDDGRLDVTLPDERTESVAVTATRGDFVAEGTIELRLLEIAIEPDGIAPVPGSPGEVVVTFGDVPVSNTEVRLDGELLGTTDETGAVATSIPTDPTATLAASAEGQTVTESYLSLYWRSAIGVASVIGGLLLATGLAWGRRGPMAVAGTAAAIGAVLVIEAFHGTRVGLLTVLAVLALAGGLWYRRRKRLPPMPEPPNPRETTVGIATAVEQLHSRVAQAIRSTFAGGLPRPSIRGIVRTTGTAIARGWWLWLPTTAGIAGGGLLVGLEGSVVGGFIGALVTLGWASGSVRPFGEGDADSPLYATSMDVEPDPSTVKFKHRFRRLWRAFARQVAPRRWTTSTTVEIERRAVDRGYPQRPVEALAETFRRVEYGGESLTGSIYERATAAYRSLMADERAASEEESV